MQISEKKRCESAINAENLFASLEITIIKPFFEDFEKSLASPQGISLEKHARAQSSSSLSVCNYVNDKKFKRFLRKINKDFLNDCVFVHKNLEKSLLKSGVHKDIVFCLFF